MKKLNRREFLVASGAVAGSSLLPTGGAAAKPVDPSCYDSTIAVLYDATKCIGCRSCIRACREKNELPAEEKEINGVKFDSPEQLSKNSWTVVQVYREEEEAAAAESREPNWSYVKRNCMHCNEPACVSVCPVAALQKDLIVGAVVYNEDRCIGCRYCLIACPYHVPRYEWVDRVPRVRKCNWNRACVRACPVGALKQGRRTRMIAEAHRRIEENPDRYVDHVYGEHEGGGTNYLILAGVEHKKLGLPLIPTSIRASYAKPIMDSLPGWIVGLALFLGGWYQMTKRGRAAEPEAKDEKAEEHPQ